MDLCVNVNTPLSLLIFENIGITEARDPETFPYLTTEKTVFFS